MRSLPRPLVAILAAMLMVACDTPSGLEPPDSAAATELAASPVIGRTAFLEECASCHAARDGFDLAFFSFPDSTIVRRAVGHVDTVTALDIAAYIRTLEADPVPREAQSFQPGGLQVDGDVAFAVGLFGEDAWPSGLTSQALAAIDPTEVPVAFSFPRWSIEENNLDWMPDEPLPRGILGYRDGAVGRALDLYYVTGGERSLEAAVLALRSADRQPDNPEAPCLVEDAARFRATECFEVRRWTSSLVAQHMLRTGRTDPMSFVLHDSWWDVGNAARKSLQHGMPIERAEENWAVWMYLGWAFSPERHASVYLATGLSRMGLLRHGTFHALRAQVVREEGRGDPYKDLATAARFAPAHWVLEAARFGYEHLIERLESGDLPDATPFRDAEDGMPESHLAIAREGLTQARAILRRRLSGAEMAELRPLDERVAQLLGELGA